MPGGHKFRITGGTHKGRPLLAPANLRTRPMQGFLREALFNILQNRIEESSVLDLFSGTGSIGLEALSRGASSCLFIESYKPAFKVLRNNITSFGFEDRVKALNINLLRLNSFPSPGFEPYDLIFLDPPFAFHDSPQADNLNRLIQIIENQELLSADPLLVLQVRKEQSPPELLGSLEPFDLRPHGSVTLIFYR
ncbi:MAG: 16S rRNA (guanine(966)-N(2))-methyltransferase RsmD [Planctomycetota bacterium]|jgi:16S rRNA (guanine(966)-N(2))-methyltransferase RsmD